MWLKTMKKLIRLVMVTVEIVSDVAAFGCWIQAADVMMNSGVTNRFIRLLQSRIVQHFYVRLLFMFPASQQRSGCCSHD